MRASVLPPARRRAPRPAAPAPPAPPPARRWRRPAPARGQASARPRPAPAAATSCAAASRSGSTAKAGAAAAMKCRHLGVGRRRAAARDDGARPRGRRQRAACGVGARPKFAGRPIAMPEPAVTSGSRGSAAAERAAGRRRDRVDDRDARRPRPAARRTVRAPPPRRARPRGARSARPRRGDCACSTRTRLASVIGVSGWWRMPLSRAAGRRRTGGP